MASNRTANKVLFSSVGFQLLIEVLLFVIYTSLKKNVWNSWQIFHFSCEASQRNVVILPSIHSVPLVYKVLYKLVSGLSGCWCRSDGDKSSPGKLGKGSGPLTDISGTLVLPYIKRTANGHVRAGRTHGRLSEVKPPWPLVSVFLGNIQQLLSHMKNLTKGTRLYTP